MKEKRRDKEKLLCNINGLQWAVNYMKCNKKTKILIKFLHRERKKSNFLGDTNVYIATLWDEMIQKCSFFLPLSFLLRGGGDSSLPPSLPPGFCHVNQSARPCRIS